MRPLALALLVIPAVAACSSSGATDGSDEAADTAAIRPFDHCDPGGPCPDLKLNADVLKQSIFIETRDVDDHSCSVNEGTILSGGRRRLLRFTTSTTNIGTGDLFLGDPSKGSPDIFEFAPCHGHFHFKGYADYVLKNLDGSVAAKGHKESFCIEDNIQGSGRSLPPRPPEHLKGTPPGPPDNWTPAKRTNCHHPGLHRGWTDAYFNTTEGNWIDITDVAPGDYILSVHANPEHMIAELRFDNNDADVPVHIPHQTTDGNVCPASSDAIFRCADDGSSRSRCLGGQTTRQSCPSGCGQPDETAHPGRCL
jgi:hypothetical protein